MDALNVSRCQEPLVMAFHRRPIERLVTIYADIADAQLAAPTCSFELGLELPAVERT